MTAILGLAEVVTMERGHSRSCGHVTQLAGVLGKHYGIMAMETVAKGWGQASWPVGHPEDGFQGVSHNVLFCAVSDSSGGPHAELRRVVAQKSQIDAVVLYSDLRAALGVGVQRWCCFKAGVQ